jgi:hypothetical protein
VSFSSPFTSAMSLSQRRIIAESKTRAPQRTAEAIKRAQELDEAAFGACLPEKGTGGLPHERGTYCSTVIQCCAFTRFSEGRWIQRALHNIRERWEWRKLAFYRYEDNISETGSWRFEPDVVEEPESQGNCSSSCSRNSSDIIIVAVVMTSQSWSMIRRFRRSVRRFFCFDVRLEVDKTNEDLDMHECRLDVLYS